MKEIELFAPTFGKSHLLLNLDFYKMSDEGSGAI